MKILVCVKQVPDTTEVKLGADFTLERDFVAQIMNPADESALELGLALRDLRGGSVTVLTMGPERAAGMLHEALSRGADEAVLLTDPAFAGSDTLATARALRAAHDFLGGFDLILCGRRATDGETGQVGPMLGSLLNRACVTNVTAARVETPEQPGVANGAVSLLADQLTEDGTVLWRCATPALLTLCEWSYRLRLPTLAGLRRAATAPVRTLTAAMLYLSPAVCGLRGSPTRVVRVSARSAGLRPCRKLTVEAFLGEGVLP
ncbi:MAG: electron transfer flavoprotein subunit beta/FixA family protein [Clostridiales bacterium]|nr:electron transfer flavoprotein subunit beta/FixA family protein [Clostridiales bacterium]